MAGSATVTRFGVIGAGAIAGLACRELARLPEAELVAVADPHLGRARALAERHGAAHVFDDAASLLELDVVDAVYIAVPNRLHAPLARAALEAGKHTLLDKPFALNLAEARSVVAAAEASGRHFMLGMNQRFTREVQTARALVARGALGEVYHVKAYWRRREGIPRIGSWFTHRSEAGGGSLLDIGVHVLDAALYVLDDFDAASVSGATNAKFGVRGLGEIDWGRSEVEDDVFDVEDFATALVRLASGRTVALDAAWAMHQGMPAAKHIELFGTDAGYSVYESKLYRRGKDGYLSIEVPSADDLAHPHMSRMQHFLDLVAGREGPVVTATQALAVQGILDAVYASAADGQEVTAMTAPLSVQLYSLRDASERDFDGVLTRLAEMGYAGVEPFALVRHDAGGVSAARGGARHAGLVEPLSVGEPDRARRGVRHRGRTRPHPRGRRLRAGRLSGPRCRQAHGGGGQRPGRSAALGRHRALPAQPLVGVRGD